MPKFTLTMSARSNGETVTTSYTFELGRRVSEEYLIRSYQEFYSDRTDIEVVEYYELASETLAAA